MSAVRATSLVAAALLLIVAAARPSVARQTRGLSDLEGRVVDPLAVSAPALVFVFTAVDCPISDRYAPEVRRLAARFQAEGIAVWLVYANAGEQPAAVRAHAAAFGYGLPVVLDPAATLADRAGAQVTPEAAVFDAAGRLAYRGRIDDRYVDFGVDRPAPTTRELADAVAAVRAGRDVATPVVPAVGCAIVRQRP